MRQLDLGLSFTAQLLVDERKTALAAMSGGLPVLGTPYLAALMESAAYQSVQPFLDGDETTVGTHLDLFHQAPTLVGRTIEARSRLTGVDGRRLTFEIEAYEGEKRVGVAVHERVVVREARFLEKAREA